MYWGVSKYVKMILLKKNFYTLMWIEKTKQGLNLNEKLWEFILNFLLSR